jgi:deazaflavin-dependent oxidoreductase (nitroreductase family)
VAATYRLSAPRRAVNALVRQLLRLGLGPSRTYLLTVPGRRTGRPCSTPVTLVEGPEGRWLVAPYGAVGWVWNVRAAGGATLSRGRRMERVHLVELGPLESAPVLRRYVAEVPVTRPFFDARAGDPLEAFEAEAARHPVFRITSGTASSDSTRRTPGRSA